ncbi:MAG: valine--tRNA ligase, partial [Hadesarchaea archaeon]|nr:valine--tRNA ligase [Hadesarchaea archaeon]
MEIPKSYNPEEAEPKWQKHWRDIGIHNFNHEDEDSSTYVIDTPPPYPSGEFHIGNALNWIYFDIVARYKRMTGHNVLFPQGWDCHGLPTEVQVEKQNNIRKDDVSREKFRELCVELTEKNISHMKNEMDSLGLSIDWSTEYRTMNPEYYGKTQLSFLKLFEDDLIYQGKHPVNWCPRCETAIADAEVEYEDKEGTLNYIEFEVVGEEDELIIATTRPELLPACVLVAVHPDDDKYSNYVGKELEVPIFNQTVKIVEDSEVDPEFGTGVVMICTYGDKADVEWAKRYDLPVIESINKKGELTEVAEEYAGLTVDEAKEKMIDDLDEEGLLEKQEPLEQNVGVCWRCKTPVEILTTDQWFMRVRDLNDRVVEEAKKIRWVPEHMRLRLIDWAKSMDWDWVISRQRIFATPIPIWYCSNCEEPIIASEDQLPVIPQQDDPPVDECPKCGNEEFEPEEDVLDTWMDSSITIAMHAGWPDLDPRLFPADLQPNGTDIIRTWDYYLLVRHLALLGEAPYNTVLINGMVFGEDGRKMSKSQGNFVETTKARERHGTDALRQWAAIGATPGSDVPFSWKEIDFGQRFLTKLWNAARFSASHISEEGPGMNLDNLELRPPDKWILSRLNNLVKESTELMNDFQFNHVLREIRTFVW